MALCAHLHVLDVVGTQQVGADEDVLVAHEGAALFGLLREQPGRHALKLGLVVWRNAVPDL